MLNVIEYSDAIQFINGIEDERMKNIMTRMCSEYGSYSQVGTPEECKRYQEWCDLKPSDYMKLFDNCTRALKDELECTEKFYKEKVEELEQKLKSKKRK